MDYSGHLRAAQKAALFLFLHLPASLVTKVYA
jgi:hypothetical protein